MAKKRKHILIATCVLLLSIASVMALEGFSSPKGTFMKVESQEELRLLMSTINVSGSNPIYLLMPSSIKVSAQCIENKGNITKSSDNCKACLSDTPKCVCETDYLTATTCPCSLGCPDGCASYACDGKAGKWSINRCTT